MPYGNAPPPARGFLDAVIGFLEVSEGILLEELPIGSQVNMTTRNSVYVFRILDPAIGLVEVLKDTACLTAGDVCRCRGSTLGGTSILSHWLVIGWRLEINCGQDFDQTILTSTIKTIRVV